MIDLICPKCKTIITVRHNTGNIYCPKCLASESSNVIMYESQDTKKPKNLGGGFFEKPKES
jgi:uncharacterized Zn finger protein (UPF0148 family)